MLSIRHPHPAAPSWYLVSLRVAAVRDSGKNQSVFPLLSSRHSRNRSAEGCSAHHGGVGVSPLLSPRAVPSEWRRGGVPRVSPLTCAVHLVKLVISVFRIVQVAINETVLLGPSHLSIRAYAERMQLKSAATAFGVEDTHCSDQRIRTTRIVKSQHPVALPR